MPIQRACQGVNIEISMVIQQDWRVTSYLCRDLKALVQAEVNQDFADMMFATVKYDKSSSLMDLKVIFPERISVKRWGWCSFASYFSGQYRSTES